MKPEINIVSSLFRSRETLRKFFEECEAALQNLGFRQTRYILVDDKCPEESGSLALQLADELDISCEVYWLAFNEGQHRAYNIGLSKCDAPLVLLVDSDMEESLSILPQIFRPVEQNEADMCFGRLEKRRKGLIDRLFGSLHFTLLSWLSEVRVERNIMILRVMNIEFVRAFVRYQGSGSLLSIQFSRTGFRQRSVLGSKDSSSPTTYSLRAKMDLFRRGLVAGSSRLAHYTAGVVVVVGVVSFFVPETRSLALTGILLSNAVILLFLGQLNIASVSTPNGYVMRSEFSSRREKSIERNLGG